MQNNYAPIIVFAFNRVDAIKNLTESLLRNEESSQSDIFFFVDGPRANKHEDIPVNAVKEYIKSITGFKSINYSFSDVNNGLGNSIIKGVTEVIEIYGKAIILEDDLICSKNLLSFMNQGLDKYQDNKDVFSICGYTNTIKLPKGYNYDAYSCVRSSSWGWATWKDRWNSIDWKLTNWEECKKHKSEFNKWGGSDCFGMLKGWKEGKNKSWAIRFCYSQFVQNKIAIFPTTSKISNEGFDGSGTNCKKYSRFKSTPDNTINKIFKWPNDVTIIKTIKESALSYHTIYKRIYSKIIYILQK